MRPSTRRLLERARRPLPLRRDLGPRAARRGALARGQSAWSSVVGNHGLEPWQDPRARSRAQVGGWRAAPRAGSWRRSPGVDDRGQGLLARRPLPAVAARSRRPARRPSPRRPAVPATCALVGGKQVVNVLPAGRRTRGWPSSGCGPSSGCDTALYVGDDETDEDVFALDRPGRLLAIRVGRKRSSSAAFYVRAQADVDRLLRASWPSGRGPTSRRAPCRRPARPSSSCGCSGRSTTACSAGRSGWRRRWA